jgi:folate-dependent tRNA-U54 methylase TrmFO/GidA
MAAPTLTAVPAGGALAVDRERFSATITGRIDAHPRITARCAVVTAMPDEAGHGARDRPAHRRRARRDLAARRRR